MRSEIRNLFGNEITIVKYYNGNEIYIRIRLVLFPFSWVLMRETNIPAPTGSAKGKYIFLKVCYFFNGDNNAAKNSTGPSLDSKELKWLGFFSDRNAVVHFLEFHRQLVLKMSIPIDRMVWLYDLIVPLPIGLNFFSFGDGAPTWISVHFHFTGFHQTTFDLTGLYEISSCFPFFMRAP